MRFVVVLTALGAAAVAGFGAFVAAIANHYLEQCSGDIDDLDNYINALCEDDRTT